MAEEAPEQPVEETADSGGITTDAGEAVPAEAKWASANSLPEQPYKDITLPIMNQRVRVMYIGQTDSSKIGFLPEMKKFAEIMAERMLSDVKEGETPDNEAFMQRMEELEQERLVYMLLVAHAYVVDPNQAMTKAYCSACGLQHYPALWARDQVELLEKPDLIVIVDVAERREEIEAVLPFLRGPTPDATPEQPTTGESTPEPTSSAS